MSYCVAQFKVTVPHSKQQHLIIVKYPHSTHHITTINLWDKAFIFLMTITGNGKSYMDFFCWCIYHLLYTLSQSSWKQFVVCRHCLLMRRVRFVSTVDYGQWTCQVFGTSREFWFDFEIYLWWFRVKSWIKMAFHRIFRIFQDSLNVINLLFILTLYLSLNEQVDASRSIAFRGAHARDYPDDEDFMRQVPLCVDPHNMHPEEEGLARWTWVFDYYRYNTYIPVSNGKTSPSGMITKVTSKNINLLWILA